MILFIVYWAPRTSLTLAIPSPIHCALSEYKLQEYFLNINNKYQQVARHSTVQPIARNLPLQHMVKFPYSPILNYACEVIIMYAFPLSIRTIEIPARIEYIHI